MKSQMNEKKKFNNTHKENKKNIVYNYAEAVFKAALRQQAAAN